MQPPNQRFSLSAKMNETQRRTMISPRRIHCTYCGMPTDISQAEATSNSEKIEPVALAIIELCLTKGISEAVSQKKILFNKYFKILWQPLKAF